MPKKGEKWVFGRGYGGDGNSWRCTRPNKYYEAVWKAAKNIGESTPLFTVPNPFRSLAILKGGHTYTARSFVFPVMLRYRGDVYVVIWRPDHPGRKLFAQIREKIANFYDMRIIWVKRKGLYNVQDAEIFMRKAIIKIRKDEERIANESR